MKLLHSAFVFSLVWGGSLLNAATPPLVQQAVLGSGTSDYFGASVSISGDTVVIGAPLYNSSNGRAQVYTRAGIVWSLPTELTLPLIGDQFGASVAVSGDTAVIGAPLTATQKGAAYVFTRQPAHGWSLEAELLASDGAANDRFGWSVAVSGDTAVVGAPGRGLVAGSTSPGAVYVFTRSATTWTQQVKLIASDAAAGDLFGHSVALSGDTVVIGAPLKAAQQGAVYVFTGSGAAWGQQAMLTASDGNISDNFGRAVATSGDTILVGSPYQSEDRGQAYVYTRAGVTWTEEAKLAPVAVHQGDRFGQFVGLDANLAAVGMNPSSGGGAYLFTRTNAPHATWSETQRLWSMLGSSTAVSGDTVVVGAAREGLAYVLAPPPALTVTSIPTGIAFHASGTDCPSGTLVTPYTLPGGIGCTVGFDSPVLNGAGNARYTFDHWSDGNMTNPRALLPPLDYATFTALLRAEYLLTAAASPLSGGQVSGSGWYNESANATIAALPNPGFLFTGFSGDFSGASTPLIVSMSGPKTGIASFIPLPGAALGALIASKSGPQNLRQWNIRLSNAGPGIAYAPQIHGVILMQTYGAACTPLRLSPAAFPITIPNLGSGAVSTGTALFDFGGCPATARFTVVVVFTANSGSSGGATTLANQTM